MVVPFLLSEAQTRLIAPRHLRRTSAWIFGAICPAEGKGAALVMRHCNSEAMDMHLAEISSRVAPGAHAVLMLDQAGWHMPGRLAIPLTLENCFPLLYLLLMADLLRVGWAYYRGTVNAWWYCGFGRTFL